jgi:pimeloyl-ACP methyl ester carboxylesterase
MADDELPPAVAGPLAAPAAGTDRTVEAAGLRFHAIEWGHLDAVPVLLVHGVTSSARTWWRVGPALAAAGYRVVAVDLPGHGRTARWSGHHRFAEGAADLVAFARAADIAGPDLRLVGHSWGAMVAAGVPRAGMRPARLVLVDPPAIPLAAIAAMLEDPDEHRYSNLDEAVADVAARNPTWDRGEVLVKAEGLTQFDEPAVRDILMKNGDWDGGLAALGDPSAAGLPVWVIRGDPAAGGLFPDAAVAGFEARIGAGRVVTIGGASHSPQRTHPAAFGAALLRALAD